MTATDAASQETSANKPGANKPGAGPIDPVWAWAPYEPDAQRPWDLRRAAHLYRRAAFGATWSELQQALADGPQRTIARLLRPSGDLIAFHRSYDGYERSAAGSDNDAPLRAWWLRRMIETPHPLLEKLTLCWHSHFGISRSRVASGTLMAQYLRTLRQHALGSYEDMLSAALREPAVFLGLNADAHRKAQPNMNLARQLLSQYGLGAGEFDEQDVRETARALTGWFVRREELQFVEREHDTGIKRILGQQVSGTVDEAVRIVLRQQATSRQLVGSLYRWLISEVDEPDAGLLEPLSESLRRDYDIGGVVRKMLSSNWFFSPPAYRRRIKSPVEFALGMIRPLEGHVATLRLGDDLADLGQDLLRPPTVKGWPGGRCWLNPITAIRRVNLAVALLTPGDAYGNALDAGAVAKRHGQPPAGAAADFFLDLLLGGDVPAPVRRQLRDSRSGASGGEPFATLRTLVQDIAALPEFQLC